MAVDAPHTNLPELRVALISLDRHLTDSVAQAEARLRHEFPAIEIAFHAASDWRARPAALASCREDIAKADIVIASMLFMDDHIEAVRPALEARSAHCDAFAGCLSASEIVKLTRLDRFTMSKPTTGPLAFMKRLRGARDKAKAGAHQAKMLRRLPQILKFVPGAAQDVRAYFLTLQYLLSGSDDNIENLVRFLIDRYADGPRAVYRGAMAPKAPAQYPDVGVYHPAMTPTLSSSAAKLPLARSKKPTVGLLLMRSYLLSNDTGHYDGVIAALEARGLRVVPAFASGLDARPAIKRFFMKNGAPTIDALVSLTGFSLVGGPAYNDADAAAAVLSELDAPYIAAHALELQTLESWRDDARGLSPVEATMMVAIPELDGGAGPLVFGGRSDAGTGAMRMQVDPERADMLSRRVEKLIRLRRTKPEERKLAITLFNFPPNGGGVGTAAYLSVYESLFALLKQLSQEGYDVDLPANVDALRDRILGGNSAVEGADANVYAKVSADEHVRREKRLKEIESQWGPAPGRIQTDGRSIRILGVRFGNVFVGVQPSMGYEGDPMRLLFEKSFAPTHAFAAYYRYLKEEFGAHAALHFGTHGALEFMPGKHAGMTADCWPDYLIGDLPNFYFYAANNPSEAAIAKRRAAATTISYLTPSLTKAGLYASLQDLRSTIERWRRADPQDQDERARIFEAIAADAQALDLIDQTDLASADEGAVVAGLQNTLRELETALIPDGLHIAGAPPSREACIETLAAMTADNETAPRELLVAIADRWPQRKIHDAFADAVSAETINRLSRIYSALSRNEELRGLVRALDGGFTPPVAGGDLLSNPDILPTGRNIHGFDPFRLPTKFALADGAAQTRRLIERAAMETGARPATIAMVLWGTDNLKSEGAQLAQALALIGAEPRLDSYGRLAGAQLIPLETLGRPRIDVIATLSGIFRDLLPLQTKLLAEAALLAARADEPLDQNAVRRHALEIAEELGCDLDTAALRVFSNAEGAYGSNVNQMIEASCWEEGDDLANAFTTRKCFAYGADGVPTPQPAVLDRLLRTVDLAYQNLESVELGLTTIDHYFDTLGGIGQAVKRARGDETPVYIGDQTRGDGVVRTLTEQVALESRTRTLNPKWYEGMLRHGYEGVRQIEAHVTNTMGWSATTGQVEPWVYQRITETFMLDEELRERLASLNPKSCAKVASRLLEASDRKFWTPDPDTLDALKRAGEELEDRMEGVVRTSAVA